MPILKHLNNLDMKINKRITKAMRKQASVLLPDVPPQAQPTDVTSNFTSLLKSIQYLTILMEEINIDASQAKSAWEQVNFNNDDGSVSSLGSQLGSIPSSRSSASSSSAASLSGNLDFTRVYNDPSSRNFNSNKYSVISKEAINIKFYTKALEGMFSYLTKPQIATLKKSIVKSIHALGISRNLFKNTDVDKQLDPIEKILGDTYTSIFGQLKSEGDPFSQVPRLSQELGLPSIESNDESSAGSDSGAGRICGSTLSVYGAGRKNRLLSPAVYRAHQGEAFIYPNTNQLFTYNLAKRNI
jgi:hypothetical protein